MKDLFWFTVAFLSGNQFRNLFCKITAGFMGYRAAYPLRTSCMSPYSWHIMALLYRIIPIFFLWNILAHHLGNALTYLTRFNPTFSLWTCLQNWLDSFGYIIALHRGHFITTDTIAYRIVYKVAYSNLLCRALMDSFIKALSDSFTFFDTLSRAHFLETVLHTCSGACLHCRTFSTLHWWSVPMSHSFSWVIFFMYICTLLHSLRLFLNTICHRLLVPSRYGWWGMRAIQFRNTLLSMLILN